MLTCVNIGPEVVKNGVFQNSRVNASSPLSLCFDERACQVAPGLGFGEAAVCHPPAAPEAAPRMTAMAKTKLAGKKATRARKKAKQPPLPEPPGDLDQPEPGPDVAFAKLADELLKLGSDEFKLDSTPQLHSLIGRAQRSLLRTWPVDESATLPTVEGGKHAVTSFRGGQWGLETRDPQGRAFFASALGRPPQQTDDRDVLR